MTTWQQCAACGNRLGEMDPRVWCDCGGLLEVQHDPPSETAPRLKAAFQQRLGAMTGLDRSGVWRYRELVLPTAADQTVTYPEGNTPLLHRPAVCRWAGLSELTLKHEGHNPTGSFKDRGMTVGVTQALRIGARAIACASTGNTSASLAAYGAQAGIPALVFVPLGQVAMGKLAQSLAYGARTLLVRGDFDQCLRLAQRAGEELGVYLLNSINPFRLEGQKTILLELLHQLEWQVPDWIVFPAGNLGNASAFGKALREAKAWGFIDQVPRLAAVQAAELKATVDRREAALNEHVALTISLINSDTRLRAEGISPNVDLSVLTKDFDIGTPHVENRYNIYRGRGRSTSELSVDLFPRRDGRLVIPAFRVDGLSTAPIIIEARKLPAGAVADPMRGG